VIAVLALAAGTLLAETASTLQALADAADRAAYRVIDFAEDWQRIGETIDQLLAQARGPHD
jgi:hypothetical protein